MKKSIQRWSSQIKFLRCFHSVHFPAMSDLVRNSQSVGAAPGSLTDLKWLQNSVEKYTQKSTISLVLEDFSGQGGMSSATMKRLKVKFADNTEKTYVYKCTSEGGYTRSKDLGLPREAFFYHYLAPKLASRGVSLPQVVYVHGNMDNGEKIIVLEDLSTTCVQSGYFFGPGSPLNWGKDIEAIVRNSRAIVTGSSKI